MYRKSVEAAKSVEEAREEERKRETGRPKERVGGAKRRRVSGAGGSHGRKRLS
jgi:hypothetical protein